MQTLGGLGWIAAVVVARLVAMWAPPAAFGAEASGEGSSDSVLSDRQIEQALSAAKTRSMPTRGLARRTDANVDAATAPPPTSAAVNLNVPFEYNSSTLKPEASTQLLQLQRALNSNALRADRFLVAGHTDAKGSAAYNKKLSLRRAESVKQFLAANGVEASRMNTVGYGSEQLLLAERPVDARNRRVEIRDLGAGP